MSLMIVAELQEWLAKQNPQSPVCIMGIADCGASVQKWDINLGTGQGPSDDIDEVVISWVHTTEAEARYETQKH
ncbi:hypothetical protein ACFQZ8_02350 [Micromonospora azadirachtae]|uniref:Uncharacterized protein n=1 Tax=Micromonospora azadirachtae TaxID=1970735 RepID=A0ABW2ZVT9_9ACTN